MINAVSSASSAYATGATQSTQTPPAAQQKAATPQDTVHLSQAALAGAGDADHDGDSH
jgi:hypothetical protein